MCVPRIRIPLKAITLIEVIITGLILSIGIVMILKSFFSASNADDYSVSQVAAVDFADKEIDLFRQQIASGQDYRNLEKQGAFLNNGRKYIWGIDFLPVAGEDNKEIPSLKELRFNVNWTQSGIAKSQSVFYYLNTGESS